LCKGQFWHMNHRRCSIGESWLVRSGWLARDVMLARRQQSASRPNCLSFSSSLSCGLARLGSASQPGDLPWIDCRRASVEYFIAAWLRAANEWVDARPLARSLVSRSPREQCVTRRRVIISARLGDASASQLMLSDRLCPAPATAAATAEACSMRTRPVNDWVHDLWQYFAGQERATGSK